MQLTPHLLILKTNNFHKELAWDYLKALPNFNFKSKQSVNLNWLNQTEENLKIKTVRDLNQQVSFGQYNQQPRVFVLLRADLATIPAQNALLKLLEEPPINTLLILTVNQSHKLLPTIQSRCLIKHRSDQNQVPEKELEADSNMANYLKLLSKPSNQTYSQIINLVQQVKDREQAKNLLEQLLYHLQTDLKSIPLLKKVKASQQTLKAYQLLEQNANYKLVLENLFFSWKNSR